MSMDWLNFKSCLSDSGNTVVYIDNKGSEIPIESECEFQEAIRLAKLNKKRLKLILYYNKSEANNTLAKNQCEYSNISPLYASLETVKPETMQQDSVSKEKCHCNGDVPPDWFMHYMKKFKKELLQELKSSLCDTIQNAVEKEKKLSSPKGEITDLSCGKIEATSAVVTTQSKKKKKGSEKDVGDLLDQREIKSAKKNDKLHSTKFERLEKLDNKTRVLLEEKRRLLEKKRHSKQRLDKNCGITSEIEKLKRSASFPKNEVCLFLPPNAEFVVTLNFTNDGMLRWEAPWLECFDFNGLYPKEVRICLPRLRPMESGFTTLRGKVSDCGGLHHFKCRLFDGLKEIGPEFICWARVEIDESIKKVPNAIVSFKESDDRKSEDSVGILIDFEKDEFAVTQKKIEENINEIERRLQDIDLLRPYTPLEDSIRNNPADLKNAGEFQGNGCESLENIEGKEINWKEKLEQEGVHFGVDCLRLATPNNNQLKKQQDENGRVDNSEKLQKNDELESSSDSELSVIFLSEEDENFIVIPLPSKSPSPAESMNEDKKFVRTPSEGIPDASEAKSKSVERKSLESIRTESMENKKKAVNICEMYSRAPAPLRNRRSPLGEISKSKTKKIKPSSTEYHFTSANLTQPTFIQNPERFSEERPSKFTFTGDKDEEKSAPKTAFEGGSPKHIPLDGRTEKISVPEGEFISRYSKPTPTQRKEAKSRKEDHIKNHRAPTTDAFNKVIFAVSSSGYCIPVGDPLKYKDHCRISRDNPYRSFRKESENSNRSERRYGRCNDVPAPNIFPSGLMNGASNLASLAIKTTKSVINDLHGAFMTDGKTEMGKPAYENRGRVSPNAMFTLYEMGFSDVEMNRKMLITHENNLVKALENLIQMHQNPSQRNA